MANTTRRLLNQASVQSIMNKRKTLNANLVGKKVVLTIRGNGTQVMVTRKIDGSVVESIVEPGTPFEKVIFNTNMVSSIAMANKANWEFAKSGQQAEKAGDFEAASDFFTTFLNKMQVSFNVPTTSPILAALGDNTDVEARVVRIDTENGSLLTIDPATIRVLKAIELKDTVFSFDMLGEEPVEGENEAKEDEGATGAISEVKDALTA